VTAGTVAAPATVGAIDAAAPGEAWTKGAPRWHVCDTRSGARRW
jgi:hypothetical protein